MKKVLQLKPGIIFILLLPIGYVAPDNSQLVVNMIGYFFYFIWIGTIGYYVPKPVIQDEIKSDTALFFGSLLLFTILFVLKLTAQAGIFGENWIKAPVSGLIICALLFYPVIYVSKAIVKMELKREVSVGDYILTVILLLPGISVIGAWVVQPRLRKLFGNTI